MKLNTLLESISNIKERTPGNPDVQAIAYDSRKVKPAALFVALRGRIHDGNTFSRDAVDNGACGIISDESLPDTQLHVPFIQVADSRQALAEVSCAFYQQPSQKLRVIGVTGTNGKTTVAYMIRDVLLAAGKTPGLIGTINYEIGERTIPASRTTPESPELQELLSQMVNIRCESVVMEVSSHALVQQRVSGIDFNAAVFTNLTQDHLDYHHTMEEYFEVKANLFDALLKSKTHSFAVINIDDPWGMKLAPRVSSAGTELITYGSKPEAVVRVEDFNVTANGSRIFVRSPWGDAKISLKLLGRFNVYNALAAFATCAALKIEPPKVGDILSNINSVSGRLEKIATRKGFQVFVDYAHTDDALKNVLVTLREISSKRLIIVFGCGGNRDKKKRPLMGAVAERLADYAILTSDNPRMENPSEIISEISAGFKESSTYEIIEDRKEAIKKALTTATAGDTVLIAGKGHETYQEFGNRIIPFDDRQIACEFLK